jgi:regulation of enolase protein 1 (concanavalin A-like superfamily)
VPTGDNSASGGHYNWSSPLIVNGFAYIGIASLGDCPLVQGELLKVNLATHAVVATVKLVPDGQAGGGIWTSPAYDSVTGKIYAVTGTEQSGSQTFAQAIVAIDSNSMQVVDDWHLPETQAVADSDWTTSTLLYTDSQNHQLVLATNKNGITYAFQRANLAAGPIWQQTVALGNECAACGFSTVSSATLDATHIFQAGGVTVVNGVGSGGSVQGWNRDTGAVMWQHPTVGPVIGALTDMNGMVIDGAGSAIEVLSGSTGQRLYSYDTGPGNLIFAAAAVGSGTIVTGNTGGMVVALALPATLPSPPPADSKCPAAFICQDIGSPRPSGSESVQSGAWSIRVGGSGIGGTSDSFRFMSRSTAGDAQVIAEVSAQQNTSTSAQAGVMIRQSNDAGSPYYAVLATPGGTTVQYRYTLGGKTTVANVLGPTQLPFYLEIQRLGDTLQAATSTDGNNFTLVPGSTAKVIMPYTSLVGLAVSSDVKGTAGTAIMANVGLGAPSNLPQNASSGSTCPPGWTCSDLGDPLTVGNQSLINGAWSVSGAGSGIAGQSDQVHFVWQTAGGDSTLSSHITGLTNAASAEAGVMMRGDASANAAYYGAFVTANGIEVRYRDVKGLPANVLISIGGAPPTYVRVARSGATFSTYTSPDGSSWTPVVGATRTISSLGASILAGLAATSSVPSTLTQVTADQVTVTGSAPAPPTACPTTWTCGDVGAATIPAGSQYLISGTWSILAGGKDIWGTSDEFHFVAQTLSGGATIAAHVSSQGDSDPWAKAGLMIRGDTSGDSPYFAIFVTPGNGTVVQYRPSAGASTNQLTGVPTDAPSYVRVDRTGNSFAAYTSSDGVNWPAFPGTPITLSLNNTTVAGMASTSHSQFNTNTTVLDSFSLSTNGTSGGSNLPSPWSDGDVGGATPAGSASVANNVFTVNGGGNDIWGTLDQFHYVDQPFSGDGSIVARVTSQTNTDPWAKAGVMIKQSTTAGSNYALLAVTPRNGLSFQYDFNGSTGGGPYTFPNAWLKLARSGNSVTAFSSTDGTSWTTVGSTTVTLTDPVTIGLFVSSHNSGAVSTVTLDSVNVSAASTPPLPVPWSDGDIGGATPAGSASFANNVFTVNGGGNDIWGSLDQFNYGSQTLTGNGTITARVTSQTNTDPWAKAGVMIKQSTAAGSNYALLAVTPGNGIAFQYGFSTSIGGGSYSFPNAWLRVIRNSNTVTAFTSANGATWTQVGTTTVTLNDLVTVGLFATSHNAGALSTATFDNVSVTSP